VASAEEALTARLAAVVGVTTLISTRAYPVKLPQIPTLPAVTYQRISTVQESAMGVDTTIVRVRFQINSYAASYSAVKALAAAVKAALKRFSGTSATVAVLDTFADSEEDLYGQAESDARIYGVRQDFIMCHREI
jgi:hypothetical protein